MDGIAGMLVGHAHASLASISRMKNLQWDRLGGRDVAWFDEEVGGVLGYRRCVETPSADPAAEPTASANGRWVVALNGRLYNHLEIRRRIDQLGVPHPWRSLADSETLAQALDAWGFDLALTQVSGQFAIAAWDRSECCLWLARDRLGEKSLYYGWLGSDFVFASELRPIRALDGARHLSVSPESLSLLASLNYIPAPRSIYREISKLVPGGCVRLEASRREAQTQRYWVLPSPCGDSDPALRPEEQARVIDAALRDAVRRQMTFDLPTGALLSGGIDSSLVVALLQAESARPVKTFTIGFEDALADESPHARAVARHLGTDHHELMVTSKMALEQIPNLPALLDEPMGDSSQIPTMCVLGFAQHVSVVFGGDGADELFSGYGRYRRLGGVWRAVRWLPPALRQFGAAVAEARFCGTVARRLGARGEAVLQKARYYLPRLAYADSEKDLYLAMLMQWARTGLVLNTSRPDMDQVRRTLSHASSTAIVPFMMETDALTYLPDDVMVKVDRAAMTHGLETRAPFLDHEVAELSSSMPLNCKLGGDGGKVVLRQCLANYMPRALFERPKHGFNIPLDSWLRGPLRDWAESLLDQARLDREGYLNSKVVRSAWNAHMTGRANNGHALWSILMFQAWLSSPRLQP